MFILLGLILVSISGLAECIMDKIQFHFWKTPFSDFKNNLFWDPQLSWKNKWKNGDPKLGEKFPGSSTLFVGLTDAWHLFKTVHNLTLFSGLFFISISGVSVLFMLIWFLVARILFGLIFSLGFKYIIK
jgi:hypothetical protein